MNKKRALSIVLVLALIATSIPFSYRDVEAASATYDIKYANGELTEKEASTDKSISDYFMVKKIVSGTDGVDDDSLVDGCTITTDGVITIDSLNDIYIPASKTSTTKPYTNTSSYVMEYNKSVTDDNEDARRIESYEITTSSQSKSWAGRPTGILLPFYYIETEDLNGYFALAFQGTTTIQYTYGFVGAYREYSVNTASGNAVTFTTKTDDEGNNIPYRVNLKLTYEYSEDGETIEAFKFSMTQYFDDGSSVPVFDNVSFGIADVITGKNGFLGTNATSQGATGYLTSSNCPTSFNSDGAVAGYISGTSGNSKNNYISEIKVSLEKTDEELLADAASQLNDLYTAFVENPSYTTAEEYLAVYHTLPEETVANYSEQIQVIASYLVGRISSSGNLSLAKADLANYLNVMEYVWPTSEKATSDITYMNDSIYDFTDVVKTTAVLDKATILNSSTTSSTTASLYMFSDLKDDNDTGTSIVNEFGATFSRTNVYFYTDSEHTTSGTVLLPLISASSGLTKNASANVVYKTGSYANDTWANNLKDATDPSKEGTPKSYEEYQRVQSLDYVAVELAYVAKELPDETVPHTKIEYTVKLWADDGDGVYEDTTDVLLINVTNRAGEEAVNNYLAIAYNSAGNSRVRKAAVTKTSFDALVSMKMESPSYFLSEHSSVITTADGFMIDTYTAMDVAAKEALKSEIEAFMSAYATLSRTVQQHADVVSAYTNVTAMSEAIISEDGLADKMQALYDAFVENSTYDTAGAYFEAYAALSELNQSRYENQMADIYDWIYDGFEDGLVFSMNKTELEQYPNMLEYIWPSNGVFVNSGIYASTDIVKTTAVLNKDDIKAGTSIYMFSGLQDTSDTGTAINDKFGVTFSNVNLTYTTEAGGTDTVSVPVISASNTNLSIDSSNVVYKTINGYGKDQWATDLKNSTANTPLSYADYLKIDGAKYIAVDLQYVATEMPDATVPHTKIEFTARMWADDGDGVYEEATDVLLIDENRPKEGAESAYLAIVYLNGQSRVRKAALSADAFAALHSIEMEKTIAYPVGDLNGDEVVDDTDADLLRKYLVGLETTITESAANINGRDGVDACDLVALKVLIKEQEVLP